MSKKLQEKFTDLIAILRRDTSDNPSRTNLIQALEEAALLAKTAEKTSEYHIYLEELHKRLENVINGNQLKIDNHVAHMINFINEHHKTAKEKFAPNKWKAVLILVVAILEFIVLALALGAMLALAGAGIFGAGFLLAGMCITVDPTILQIVALTGALIGSICGLVGGIVAAAELTGLTVGAMKTSEWAGFEAHDSLWDLVVHGATKKMCIDKAITDSHGFFSQIKPYVNPQEKPNPNNDFEI